jgi:drug/metabolite transporter (DMT)-like permease
MTPTTRAWLQIHFCVLLWGFTAILGRVITLPALGLVWWRMLIVATAMVFVRRFWKGLGVLPGRMIPVYAGIGALVATHWLLFYSAIKLANASVAATSMALTPVFTALLEPPLVGRRFDVREILFGMGVIPGVLLVVGGTPELMRMGIAAGVGAAAAAAVFSSLNKRYVEDADPATVTGLEMAAGAVWLGLISALPGTDAVFVVPEGRDIGYLLLLALGCTLLPYVLALVALRRLSAFSTNLAVNMEPVYAIILAIVLLGEQHELAPRFYLGVLIILAAVFSYPLLRTRS